MRFGNNVHHLVEDILIRFIADGILVPWTAVGFWLFLPIPGTWLAMAIWGLARYLFYLRHPLAKRVQEALAGKDDEIARLKARILDEVDARKQSEKVRNTMTVVRRLG